MKKLFVTKLDRPHDETEHCADGCIGVYLASDVDARIAELEAFVKVLLPSWPDGEHYPTEMSLLQMQRDRIAELERENAELKRQVQEWKDWLAGACI